LSAISHIGRGNTVRFGSVTDPDLGQRVSEPPQVFLNTHRIHWMHLTTRWGGYLWLSRLTKVALSSVSIKSPIVRNSRITVVGLFHFHQKRRSPTADELLIQMVGGWTWWTQ
jgi:hypothetical protein